MLSEWGTRPAGQLFGATLLGGSTAEPASAPDFRPTTLSIDNRGIPPSFSSRRSAASIFSPAACPHNQGLLDNQQHPDLEASSANRRSGPRPLVLEAMAEVSVKDGRPQGSRPLEMGETLEIGRRIEEPLAWHGAGGLALGIEPNLAKKKGRTPEGVRPTRLRESGVAVSVGLSWTARGREAADSKSSESRCHRCRRQSHSRMSEGPSPLQAGRHSH